ncbi:MAG: hypothetical protein ABFS30_05245, partial [Pseudomonadota bacterium]
RCREAGLAVWVDEVQTFARTGELYAFRTFGLEDLVVGNSLDETLDVLLADGEGGFDRPGAALLPIT